MAAVRAGVAVVALVAAVAVGACGRSAQGEARLALDGSPRHPDDHGILTAAADDHIVLAGERRYPLAEDFISFSTYTMKLEPFRNRLDQFVHVGVAGGKAVWMAGFGAPQPTDPPVVPYIGKVRSVEGTTVTFADGSILALSAGVEAPHVDERIAVDIDPVAGHIRSWRHL